MPHSLAIQAVDTHLIVGQSRCSLMIGAFVHREALERDPSENSRNATSTNASVPYPVNRVAVIVRGYEYNSVGELSYLQ